VDKNKELSSLKGERFAHLDVYKKGEMVLEAEGEQDGKYSLSILNGVSIVNLKRIKKRDTYVASVFLYSLFGDLAIAGQILLLRMTFH